MGCACAVTGPNHRELERYFTIADNDCRLIKKILLLGTGSSGKSTLFKQLKCIYEGFEMEFEGYTHIIRSNVVWGMLRLLRKSEELYIYDTQKYNVLLERFDDDVATIIIHYTFKHWMILQVDMNNSNVCEAVQLVVECCTETFAKEKLPPNDKMKALGKSIHLLWHLEAIQAIFMRRGVIFSFPDNMDYFFNKAELLYMDDFHPNTEDALKTRIRTTSFIESHYEIKESFFHIFDVGGVRNERKKWIHLFDNVTTIIFVAALNDCNAVLFEDESKNAMHESIELFDEICNLKHFCRTEIVLFLNKNDLFREMLCKGYSLRQCFHIDHGWEGDQWDKYAHQNKTEYDIIDYEQKDDIQKDCEYFELCYESCINFIADQYVHRNKNPHKLVFVHIITATNRDNMEKVFWDVHNITIRSNLKRGGRLC